MNQLDITRLWLFFVFLAAISVPSFCQKNLAIHQPTYQSTPGAKDGILAVDGDMRQNTAHCSRSESLKKGRFQWWGVQLERSVSVDLVSVTLPIKESEHPVGADILVKNISDGVWHGNGYTCGTIAQKTIAKQNRSTIFIRCNPHINGNYVLIQRIERNNRKLVLCEVQVFSLKEGKNNLALGKTAAHTPGGYPDRGADRATDGNSNNHPDQGSCSETASHGHDAYWYVDLGGMYRVEEVELTIKTQDVSTLQNDHIYVTKRRNPTPVPGSYNEGDKCSDIMNLIHGNTKTFYCSESLIGQFIYIQHEGPNSLGFCEVRVYGNAAIQIGGGPSAPPIPTDSTDVVPAVPSNNRDAVTHTTNKAENTSSERGAGRRATKIRRTTVVTVVPAALVALAVTVIAIGFFIHHRKSRTKMKTSANVTDLKKEGEYEDIGFPDEYENPNQHEPASSHVYANIRTTTSDNIDHFEHTYEQLKLSRSTTDQPTLAHGGPCENEKNYDKLQFLSLKRDQRTLQNEHHQDNLNGLDKTIADGITDAKLK